jgi:hypothetical protein
VRGNPIKEWIIFSILWLLLLIPVIRLTGSRKPAAHVPSVQKSVAASLQQKEATAVIRYTGQPLSIKISQQGRTRRRIDAPPAGGIENTLTLDFEGSGIEIQLQAEWPDDSEHALEIELIADNLDARKAHLWADRELNEIVSFEW